MSDIPRSLDAQRYALLQPSLPCYADKPIYRKPWYKERLPNKGLVGAKPPLSTENWRMLKYGLDDFRDGLPPYTDDIVIRPEKGFNLTTGDPMSAKERLKAMGTQAHGQKADGSKKEGGRYTRFDVLYSKETPAVRKRRDRVARAELKFKQHPLALHEALVEAVQPDILEEVVEVLDPQLYRSKYARDSTAMRTSMPSMSEAQSVRQTKGDGNEAVGALPGGGETQTQTTGMSTRRETPDVLIPPTADTDSEDEAKDERPTFCVDGNNPYNWMYHDEQRKNQLIEGEKRKEAMDQEHSMAHIRSVTKEFCDWVSSLGGEEHNIEQATLESLFASGYETKPSLLVPIQVVDIQHVPPELQAIANQHSKVGNAGAGIRKKRINTIGDVEELKTAEARAQSRFDENFERKKYGAWYLPKKFWQITDADHPLMDPKELKKLETSETKKQSETLDATLTELHGTKTFIDYINNTKRKPHFMSSVMEKYDKAKSAENARTANE